MTVARLPPHCARAQGEKWVSRALSALQQMRNKQMAHRLALEEGVGADVLEIVELAALLHDIADWKYSGSEVRLGLIKFRARIVRSFSTFNHQHSTISSSDRL